MSTRQITGVMPVNEIRVHHGEGPVWDHHGNRLLFVDMLAGNLIVFDFESLDSPPKSFVLHIDDVLAFIRPRARGGWVAGSADALLILDEVFAIIDRRTVFNDSRIRFNEGGCDADGLLYAGTMAYEKTAGAGTLYRFGPSLEPEVVLRDVTISNGIAPRPESDSMYYIDSATQRVDLITIDSPAVRREPFIAFDPDIGTPDGMAVDSEGGIWIALWGAGRVQRFDRSGHLTHEVRLPTSQVSACTFGGSSLTTLFVTTSTIGSREGDSDAGAVFSVETDFRGVTAVPSIA